MGGASSFFPFKFNTLYLSEVITSIGSIFLVISTLAAALSFYLFPWQPSACYSVSSCFGVIDAMRIYQHGRHETCSCVCCVALNVSGMLYCHIAPLVLPSPPPPGDQTWTPTVPPATHHHLLLKEEMVEGEEGRTYPLGGAGLPSRWQERLCCRG